jgi:putative acetyltransferase
LKLNIRHFEPSDIKDLAEIYSYASVTENTSQVPFLSSRDVDKFFQSPTDYILIAELDDKVIGHVSLILSNKPREKHSASLAIAVHPDSHGKGVGKQLLAEAINQADNWLNILRLELEVYPDNEAALSLYQKFGFKVEGEKKCCNFKAGKFVDLLILARLNISV